MLPNHKKNYNNLWYYTLYSTFNQITQTNRTSPNNFLKVLQLIANCISNKTEETQLHIKNTHSDVITLQETNSIPQNTKHTSLYTYQNRLHLQIRKGLLTYIIENISFSQLNTSNTFLIELQIIKISPFNITITYCKHVHSTQLYPECLQP